MEDRWIEAARSHQGTSVSLEQNQHGHGSERSSRTHSGGVDDGQAATDEGIKTSDGQGS